MNHTNSANEASALSKKIDYGKVVKIFISRWYWILVTVIITFIISYTYLWYTPPTYQTWGSLKFNEQKSEFTELLSGGSSSSDGSNKITSEGFVIQSREVLLNAISRMDYKISFFLKGTVRSSDVYPNVPFVIEIANQDSIQFFKGLIDIKKINKEKLDLSYKVGEKTIKKTVRFNQLINVPGVSFKIKSSNAAKDAQYSFKFNSKEDFLGRVGKGLSTREATKSSNIMLLSITDSNPLFAQDMLNAIMTEYTTSDVKRRSASASQTIDFIDLQLGFLYDKVQHSGDAVVDYKQRNNIVNLSTSTEYTISVLTKAKEQLSGLELEELNLRQLEEQILNNKDITLNYALETSLGGALSSLIGRLNSLTIEKEKKAAQFQSGSQALQLLDKQISEEKKSVLDGIRLLRQKHERTKSFLRSRIAATEQEINKIPSAERDFAKIQAEYNINQKVFSYLSEKKLEAEIHRAAVVGGVTVVDKASRSKIIAPERGVVYVYGIAAGLIIGIGLILLVRFLNPYIYDKETVESLTSIPIIGVIRKFPGYIDQDNTQALSLQKPKSVFAESVRSVRTNISFLAAEKNSKVICVTSEVAGEGKSFVSVNLASTLALIEKKTVLIGADLRRSKLHRTFNTNNSKGLSTYLAKQAPLESIIHKTSLENLDFISSGPVPPNPSELLHSQAMRDLLQDLKEKYDYILLDTAPVGLVSDSIPLIRNSDINLFVIRSGASKFSAASIPNRIANEYGLKNMAIILNAFDENQLHARYYTNDYATGYSLYYYSDYSEYSNSGYYLDDSEKDKWWQFWKKK